MIFADIDVGVNPADALALILLVKSKKLFTLQVSSGEEVCAGQELLRHLNYNIPIICARHDAMPEENYEIIGGKFEEESICDVIGDKSEEFDMFVSSPLRNTIDILLQKFPVKSLMFQGGTLKSDRSTRSHNIKSDPEAFGALYYQFSGNTTIFPSDIEEPFKLGKDQFLGFKSSINPELQLVWKQCQRWQPLVEKNYEDWEPNALEAAACLLWPELILDMEEMHVDFVHAPEGYIYFSKTQAQSSIARKPLPPFKVITKIDIPEMRIKIMSELLMP